MPKISNNQITAYHKDIKKFFDIVVMYNQEHTFYAVIPNQFKSVVHHFDNDKMTELGIDIKYKSKSRRWRSDTNQEDYEYIVSDNSEGSCLSKMKKTLEYLVDKSIEQRKVIILFYNAKDECRYNNHLFNNEHPQIGIQFGLTYAIETKVGENKVYSQYRTIDWFGEPREERTELNLWDSAATIIDDTPENRFTLEALYDAFVKLRDKLTSFTATPEKLLEFIASKQKLLS